MLTLSRVVLTVTCLYLVTAVAAGQTPPPAAPAARNVVGISGVAFGDFEVRSRPISSNVSVQDGEEWRWSSGAEVFVGRHVFTTSGIPVALELPVAYVPRIAQAPLDPSLALMGLEQDAVWGATYVVPRLTGVYPPGGRWHLVMSMGAGIARFDGSRDDERDKGVGYPLSAALAAGWRVAGRWSVRLGAGGYAHLRARGRTVSTFTAGVVRHF